jgi:succinoglycan biosynthesis transport protein ExoP
VWTRPAAAAGRGEGEVVINPDTHSLAARERLPREPGVGAAAAAAAADPYAPAGAPTSSPSSSSSSSSPRDGFLQTLWRQRVLIAGVVVISMAAAALYLALATPLYRSEARLNVESAGGGIVTKDELGRPTASSGVNLHQEAERITSTPIVAHTLGDPGLQDLKTFDGVESRFDYLKEHLTVDVDVKKDLISVSFTSPEREDAARIVQSIVGAYTDFQTKKSRTATDRLVELLSSERTQLEQELEAKGREMVEFKRARGVLFNDKDRGDINLERLRAMSQALTTAQLDAMNAKSAYEEARRTIAGDPAKLEAVKALQAHHGFTPVSAAEEATLRSELFQWQTRLGDVQQQFLPNHPAVRNYQKRVDQLNIAYVAAMERRWLSLQKREAELQQSFDEQQKVAIERSADAVAYERLEQDLKLKEQQAQTLDKRIRELDLSEAASAAVEVNVVEPARVPQRVFSPDKRQTLAIALVLGLIAGLGLACARDWLDPRLRDADEIKAVLGMPILGMVPRMPANLAPAVRGQKLLLDPGSEVAEAYRALRTAITFGMPEGRAKTILVASPSSGDGKTTVASNLAIGLAQTGKRVLLLDADLRHPKQHEIFGVENGVGLADVLAHGVTPAEVAIKTVVPHLEIIPCGPSPEGPADLLNSQRFIDVMDELTDRYDHVVVDSPPVMAVTDGRIIAASCDVSILVLRADRADRKLCEMARDALASVGANLIGLVMNYVPSGEGTYSGGDAYYTTASRGARPARNGGGVARGQAGPAHPDDDDPAPLVAVDALTLSGRPGKIGR